jgi:D-alanyl-D-alanine carboxypeptidase
MTKNIRFFLIAILVSFCFFGTANIFGKDIQEFLLWQEPLKNPEIFMASLTSLEIQKKSEADQPESPPQPPAEEPEFTAKSVISVLLSDNGEEKIIYEKESDKILPIASLTKLMNADIVLENYDISQLVEVSKAAVSQEGEAGNLRIGEKPSAENLLYVMLIESSNDAAYSLADTIGQKNFVDLMNLEANYLGMKDTHFEDSTGISPQTKSSAKDLIILTRHLLEKPLVWEILSKPKFDLYSPDGVFHHELISTNEFLTSRDAGFKVIGGKTGYTSEANGCFLLVLDIGKEKELINIILGSDDRFGEMEKLINFVREYGGITD